MQDIRVALRQMRKSPGFALTVIDESEAAQVFEALREMGELLDAEAGRAPGGFA